MRLARICIRNFKSIPASGVEVNFREQSGLVVLVGKNNAGKSNILEAMAMLLGSRSVWRLSFPSEVFNDLNKPITLEAEIQGATFGDGKAAGLSDQQCHGLIRQAKRVESHPGRILFGLTVPSPLDYSNDDEDNSEPEKRSFVLTANRSEIKRKADEVRRRIVRHIAVPTVRDQSDILSPSSWTAYGRFLRNILEDSPQSSELVQIINQATEHLRNLLKAEAAALTETAKATSYVDEIGFNLTREGDPTELLRNLSIAVTYAGRTEDISRVGTGTQSAVIIGILELCLRHRAQGGGRVFSVEEPEAFLHPQAQRHVARLLRELAAENGTQVILTTHSSAVVAETDVLDIIRVDRDEMKNTRCLALPADYGRLDESQRILDMATAEMVFSDRVAFIEGPSERVLLSGISKLVVPRGGFGTCDLDQLNVSAVDVGGKGEFAKYAGLMDDLKIDWRIVADRDALDGNSLKAFLQRAGITELDSFETKRKKLLNVGVAVLSLGEIEDYYPEDALADLAGCETTEVQGLIDQHREYLGAPEQVDVIEAVIQGNREAIGGAFVEPTKPELAAWMRNAKAALREQGKLPTKYRKTGRALENWLDMPKPVIARRVATWLQEHPEAMSEKLQNLVRWVAEGMHS